MDIFLSLLLMDFPNPNPEYHPESIEGKMQLQMQMNKMNQMNLVYKQGKSHSQHFL